MFNPGSRSLQKHFSTLEKLVGNTPLFPITKAYNNKKVRIFAKLEWNQLAGSVKTRAAFNIIKQAILACELKPGMRVLDSSSGNTAISYAAVCAGLGIPVTILMSEGASRERTAILRSLGAEVIHTAISITGDQAQLMTQELHRDNPGKYFYSNQYANENNWLAHYNSTGPEIFKQAKGRITHFAAALGTTGTLMGTGRYLLTKNKDIRLVALQPDLSTHCIEGWKHIASSKAPAIFEPELVNTTISVSTDESYEWVKRMSRTEGLLISPSSAAALAGAVKLAESINEGTIVTVFPDSADKYGEVMNTLFK
jgi:cysteine synthase B